ncbi:unnamed protein product [Ectocarpus sp. 4 AP-2014]
MLGKLLARGAVATQRRLAVASRRRRVASVSLWGGAPGTAATCAFDCTTVVPRRQLGTAVDFADAGFVEGSNNGVDGSSSNSDESPRQQWQRQGQEEPATAERRFEEEEGEGGQGLEEGSNAAWGREDDNSSRGGRARRGRRSGKRYGRGGGGGGESRGKTRTGQFIAEMQELKRTGDWIGIIDMYKQACDDENVTLNRVMINTTVAALARSPRWQVSLSILQEMRDAATITPDAYTFNAALMACAHGRQDRLAFALLGEMREAGIKPDSFTFTHLATVCGHKGEWERAFSLIEEMRGAGIRPYCVAYNAVIVACGNAGEHARAVGVLEQMREEGVQLTEGTYSAAIAACGKAGQWEGAVDLLEEMKEGRDNLEPNEYCYNSAISACERASRWQEALALLREMQEAELVVTAGTYCHVVKACTNAGEISQARSLLDEMRENDMPLKKGTVAMVEKKAERRSLGHRPRSASSPPAQPGGEAAPHDSPYPEAAPDTEYANASASWTQQVPRSDAAFLGVASDAPLPAASTPAAAVEPSPRPRVHAVKHFLRSVGSHSRHRRWAEMLSELDHAIADPNTKVSLRMYEGCLAGLASGGKWVEALSVLERMESAGLKPSSRCVTAATKACAKANPPKWGLALSLVRGLEEPEVWTYVAALAALGKAGQWKASTALLEDMRAEGVAPNLYCYNGALEACRLADPPQWQHACSLLAQMKEEGTAPNEVCYKTAIHACRAASEDDVAESLLSDMIAAGFATQAEELKTPPVAAATECDRP